MLLFCLWLICPFYLSWNNTDTQNPLWIVLGWPEFSFGFFCKMVKKDSDELCGQSSISSITTSTSTKHANMGKKQIGTLICINDSVFCFVSVVTELQELLVCSGYRSLTRCVIYKYFLLLWVLSSCSLGGVLWSQKLFTLMRSGLSAVFFCSLFLASRGRI